MVISLIRRILQALLLLGVISILAFAMGKMVPGDEVYDYLSIDDSRYSSSANPLEQRTAYIRVARKRGLDLPLFYLTLSPGYYPDKLFHIIPADDRKNVRQWIRQSRNGDACINLYQSLLLGLEATCPRSAEDVSSGSLCIELGRLLAEKNPSMMLRRISDMQERLIEDSLHNVLYADLVQSIRKDIEEVSNSPLQLTEIPWLPRIQWHGVECQYHQWISSLVTRRPLTSLIDGRDAWTKIGEALKWTLWLNGLAFILAILMGVGIGIWSGVRDGQRIERLVHVILFALFAIPGFWLATLLIAFLSSGHWFTFFPAGGLGPYHSATNTFEKINILLLHLTLPVLSLALGSLAYVSRQLKQSILRQYNQPYVLSLRAQGISEKTILRRHVIRNAMFPMITMMGGSLPALLSGSLIIEVIFSIPGMGRLLYTSLLARDWPVVFPVLMLGATITVVSYILTDLVYKWADPRVKSIGA